MQDVEIPLERTAEFLDWFLATVPIEPLWVCPLRERPGGAAPGAGPRCTRCTRCDAGRTYVNVGFWSAVSSDPAAPGCDEPPHRGRVSRLGGHKSLYSDTYYPPDEFEARYGGGRYRGAETPVRPAGQVAGPLRKAVQRR